MSFSESDFPGLISLIEGTLKKYKNSDFAVALVNEIIRVYNRVPLYPGIAGMCAGTMAQTVTPDKIKAGDEVLVELEGSPSQFGTVKEISSDEITVGNSKISISETVSILKLNKNTLEEIWPTLIFPEEV
ncbi:hypothetical protein KAU33_13810 [Candidatus Dependentiae bacterium]|nr:hypothetical protein [Candidatus Dependentiae bacterium]